MSCKQRLEAYLREYGVTFERHEHRRAFTARQVAVSEHAPEDMVAKVVMVFADARMVMLVLPASHHADLTRAAAATGARDAWLADERDFSKVFADCEIGAMPPFGNLYGVPVYIDRSLAEQEQIVFQAGTHTDTIRMAYTEYARLVNPKVADIALEAQAAGGRF